MDTSDDTMDDLKDSVEKNKSSMLLDSADIRTDAFGKNISAERAYRRAERIVAAIHLVTRHVPPNEPLRIALRTSGLKLLSSILALRHEMRAVGSSALTDAGATIRKLISFVRILIVSGQLSSQNAEALVGALDELGVSLLASQRSALAEDVLLNKDELLTLSGSSAVTDRLKRPRRRLLKDIAHPLKRTSDITQSIRGRADEIISILSTKGQLGIKDIAANLPEYSEKMIQRELKSLVVGGRVTKAGAKRWSTYALAQ